MSTNFHSKNNVNNVRTKSSHPLETKSSKFGQNIRVSNAYTRNLAVMNIKKFLHNRPTTDILIKNHLVQNTMIWNIQNVSGFSPSPRNCHTASVVDNNMFILGGYGGKNSRNLSIELLVLDLEKMVWSKPFVAGSAPDERYSHMCSVVDSELILFGGFSAKSCWLNDLYVLGTQLKQRFQPSYNLRIQDDAKPSNPAQNMVEDYKMLIWYKPVTRGTPPSPRAAASSVSCGRKIYYFGGNNGAKFFNDLHQLDFDCMEWKQLKASGIAPSPRAGHSATIVVGEKMVIFGGGVPEGYSNEIFFLDLKTLIWSSPNIIGTAPSPRAGHTAIPILHKTAVLVFGGGLRQKVFGDLHMFDIEMCQWTRPADAGYLPQARAGHSCVSVSNIAYFFGGADGDSHVFNDVYSLDTAFLLLKNLSRSSKNGLEYIEDFEFDPIDGLGDVEEQYKDDLKELDKQIEHLMLNENKMFYQNNFLLQEAIKTQSDQHLIFMQNLNQIKENLETTKKKLFFGKKDKIKIEPNYKSSSPKHKEVKTPSKVKDVCNMFESISLNKTKAEEDQNVNERITVKDDKARKKKRKSFKKKRE